jgi:hypothetical protein
MSEKISEHKFYKYVIKADGSLGGKDYSIDNLIKQIKDVTQTVFRFFESKHTFYVERYEGYVKIFINKYFLITIYPDIVYLHKVDKDSSDKKLLKVFSLGYNPLNLYLLLTHLLFVHEIKSFTLEQKKEVLTIIAKKDKSLVSVEQSVTNFLY